MPVRAIIGHLHRGKYDKIFVVRGPLKALCWRAMYKLGLNCTERNVPGKL